LRFKYRENRSRKEYECYTRNCEDNCTDQTGLLLSAVRGRTHSAAAGETKN